MTTQPRLDINALAERIVARFPTLSERGRRVAIALYRTLTLGQPVPDYAIAAATRLEIQVIRAEIADWPGVHRSESGRIIGFWGLSLGETPHEFEVEGRTQLYTWSAWDALFLPELLGMDTIVRSHSPVTSKPIRLEVTPHGVTSTASGVVVSFIEPEACDPLGNPAISSFCNDIHFFASRRVAEGWLARRRNCTFVLSLAEAFELGRLCNSLRYPKSVEQFTSVIPGSRLA